MLQNAMRAQDVCAAEAGFPLGVLSALVNLLRLDSKVKGDAGTQLGSLPRVRCSESCYDSCQPSDMTPVQLACSQIS